ncbi:hypothetical protein [Duganella sp. Root198D2]|uniref:hypothetical protein n=1 Tax=Duganella sp. Root198D2 TaxID=1736489 RepID=UPI00070F09F6|nr:hypothetical protein [Duganella sp. Root198D2]KRB84089.1 hypothetical protein ASE26_08330 [Duganella sp. Root198D2]
MKKRWIAGLLIAVALPAAAFFTPVGQMSFYGARAWLSSKAHFTQCTPDPRIWCEPGAEAFGAAVAPLLPAAIAYDEQAFGMAYAAPVRVNVYASDDSFSRYGAVAPRAAGVVVLGDVHLAPKMLSWPAGRMGAIVTHELAHLHLVQRIGTAGIGKLPNWFWEGLPTYISAGGGTGAVTREDAVHAFVHGRHMVPEDDGSLLAPKQAPSYRLSHAMYYRQASMLVGWMDDKDPAAFKRLLAAVGRGEAFAGAVSGAYGRPLETLWGEFQQAMRAEILNKPSGSA